VHATRLEFASNLREADLSPIDVVQQRHDEHETEEDE
jgi:hypothetical protein